MGQRICLHHLYGFFPFTLLIEAWLSPVWSIGGFDSCVHISEEASNAATAVPVAIVSAITCAGVLGWLCVIVIVACMGTDIAAHLASPYGQPMASVYALRLGKQGTLAIWSFMFLIQFAMGMSITLSCSRQIWAFSRDNALPMSRFLKRVSRKAVPIYAVWGAVLCSLLLGIHSLEMAD
jgi:amino acid transporter